MLSDDSRQTYLGTKFKFGLWSGQAAPPPTTKPSNFSAISLTDPLERRFFVALDSATPKMALTKRRMRLEMRHHRNKSARRRRHST